MRTPWRPWLSLRARASSGDWLLRSRRHLLHRGTCWNGWNEAKADGGEGGGGVGCVVPDAAALGGDFVGGSVGDNVRDIGIALRAAGSICCKHTIFINASEQRGQDECGVGERGDGANLSRFLRFLVGPVITIFFLILLILFGGGSVVGNQSSERKDRHVAVLADEPCVGKRCTIILPLAQKGCDLVNNALARVAQKFVRFERKIFEQVGGRVGVANCAVPSTVEFLAPSNVCFGRLPFGLAVQVGRDRWAGGDRLTDGM